MDQFMLIEKGKIVGELGIFEKSLQSDGSLVFRGKATTNVVDRDNESITLIPEVFKPAWSVFLAKGAPMLAEHGKDPNYDDRKVGYYVSMTYSPETYDVNRLISDDNPPKMEVEVTGVATDPQMIKDILVGNKRSLSIGLSIPVDEEGHVKALFYNKYIVPKEITINEITVCAVPANQECSDFTIVTDESLAEQYGVKIGDRINALGQEAVVKGFYTGNDNQKYYELDYQFLKSAKVKVDDVKPEKKEYGCVMALVNPEPVEKLQAKIDKNDLYTEPNDGSGTTKGLAENPHVTLLFGLQPEVEYKTVREHMNKWPDEEAGQSALQLLKGDSFHVSEVTKFSNPNKPYDVLVLGIKSELFKNINKYLKTLPYENDYPDYKPHITLAYMQKGTADKYIRELDSEAKNLIFKVQDIVFSSADQGMKYTTLTKGITGATPETGSGLVGQQYMSVDGKETKKKEEKTTQTFTDYPQAATNAAKKVLAWKEKYGKEVKAMTPVGWARARQLANREPLSLETVKRMAQFNRHRKNAIVNPKYKDTPWKDNGMVAWLGWGGTAGIDWAIKKLDSLKKEVKKAMTPQLQESLNKLVANTYALLIQTHAFHWNLEDQDFNQFHEFFGEIYESLFGDVDEYAEHMRALQLVAPQGIQTLASLSDISPSEFTQNVQTMVSETLNSMTYLSDCVKACASVAREAGELPLENFLLDKADKYAKTLWKLRSSKESSVTAVTKSASASHKGGIKILETSKQTVHKLSRLREKASNSPIEKANATSTVQKLRTWFKKAKS